MCSCNLRTWKGSYNMDQILANPELTKEIIDNKIVSSECFRNGHARTIFRYLDCAAKERFRALFKPYDIQINNDQDIMDLATINERGIDVQKFNKNFLELAKGLVLTDVEIGNASCLLFC